MDNELLRCGSPGEDKEEDAVFAIASGELLAKVGCGAEISSRKPLTLPIHSGYSLWAIFTSPPVNSAARQGGKGERGKGQKSLLSCARYFAFEHIPHNLEETDRWPDPRYRRTTPRRDMRRSIDVRYIEGLINAPNLCYASCIAFAHSLSKCCPGRDRFNDNSCRCSLPLLLDYFVVNERL